MASQRITRDTFDAVVQEKMKRYRISLDQAISETIQEFQLEGPSNISRIPMESFDSIYRDSERYRDLPRDTLTRNWDLEKRREDLARQTLQLREYGREPSPTRFGDSFLDRLRSEDARLKERLLQEELHATNRRINELDPLRARERDLLVNRELNFSNRRWELERNALRSSEYNMARPGVFRDFRSPPQADRFGQRASSLQSEYRSAGVRGKMPTKQVLGGKIQRGGGARLQVGRPVQSGKAGQFEKIGESSSKQPESEAAEKAAAEGKDDQSPSAKQSLQLIRWSKLNSLLTDVDLVMQHKALFKVKTEACKMIVECFKCPMTTDRLESCFSLAKVLNHPALKNLRIDNDLLILLMKKVVVKNKNEFFEIIKPFDKEMMTIQQRLLRSVTPLLMACNTFELKHSILTDQRQLKGALKSTVLLCRKSMVLIGQIFASITIARQKNILEVLGLSEMEAKPSEYPNMKDSFLFGKEFLDKLKDWLKKSGNRFKLKSRVQYEEKADHDEEESKVAVETKVKEEADPAVVAQIDQLLEYASKGKQSDGEKPAFWFLFDKESSEYIYYRHKLAEFQKSTGQISVSNVQTKKPRKSPEQLACESVRAMLYARKAHAIKRKTFKCLAYSRRQKVRNLRKVKTRSTKKVLVKSEPMEVSCASKELDQKPLEGKPSTTSASTKSSAQVTSEVSTPTSEPAKSSAPATTTAAKASAPATTAAKASAPATTAAKASAPATTAAKASAPATTAAKASAPATTAAKASAPATTAAKASAPATTAAKASAPATTAAKAAAKASAPATSAAKASAPASAKAPASTLAKASAPASAKAPASTPAKASAPASAKAPASTPAKASAPASTPAKASAAASAKAPASTPAKASAPASAKAPASSLANMSAPASTPAKASASTSTPAKASAPASSSTKASAPTPAKSSASTLAKASAPASKAPASTPAKTSATTRSATKSATPTKTSPKTTESEPQETNVKDEASSESLDLDVDEKTMDTAVKLAQFVVQMGPELEQFSMENSVNNPEFWFLREKDSPAYKFYKQKVEEFKQAEEDASEEEEEDDMLEDDSELENIRADDDLLLEDSEDPNMDADCEAAEAPNSDSSQVAAFSQMPTPARPQMPRKRVSKLKVGMLPPKRVCLVDEPKVHDPVRIEYDRPRGRGYNRRKKPADLEFANKKLTQQNVGFKMLSKMGWKEGQGLGSSGAGIKNPVKVGSVSGGEGLGVENKDKEGEPQGDNFDVFRQRMMQMYRQKMVK
ncbi:SURP and G-patch domain-containing protein 2 isoform X2 [Pelobates fuscus]|uniref:SURP and G-patch domain-containing protein 2 isoform X2 n=1 Tax=Pelobates fuscus TaxID=191477 RepID=UPI002FE4C904